MIKQVAQIGGTKYNFYALKAWVELAAAGQAVKTELSFSHEDQLIVEENEAGDVHSLLVWRYEQSNLTAYVLLAYTVPQHRRKGYYGRLYKTLKKSAKRLGAEKIMGGLMVDNLVMLRVAEAQGRRKAVVWVEENL